MVTSRFVFTVPPAICFNCSSERSSLFRVFSSLMITSQLPETTHFGPFVKQQWAEWHHCRRMQFLRSQYYRRYVTKIICIFTYVLKIWRRGWDSTLPPENTRFYWLKDLTPLFFYRVALLSLPK